MRARTPALKALTVLRGLDIDQLNSRAGRRRGVGYTEPGEAADERLDEALQPFLEDLVRHVELLQEWDAVLRPLGHPGDGRSAR
jgi:hypothetical protein